MTSSMNSPLRIEVRADGAPGAKLMESDEALQGLCQSLRENGDPSSDLMQGSGMRFAFLTHPISEPTRDLMALDADGRLRNTWGRADLLRYCA
jgi:hypothetical protein